MIFNSIIFQKMIKKILFALFLLTLVSSKCRDQHQEDGYCTACDSGYALASGFCVQRMRGCLKYLPTSLCEQCQFGYVLSKGKCIRQAIFNGNFDLTPAPIVPDIQKFLTFKQIEDKLGKLYGPYFSNIHEYFLGKYDQLGKGNIEDVKSLKIKTGVILRIQYSENKTSYIAEAFMDIYNNIKEINFIKGEPKKGIFPIIDKINQKEAQKIEGFSIYKIEEKENVCTLEFIGESNDVRRFSFNKNNNPNQEYSYVDVSFVNLAKQKLIKTYPSLKEKKFFSMKNGGFIVFLSSDQQVSASLTFENYRFKVNHPVYAKQETDNLQNFHNHKDPRYLSALDYAKKQFPEIKDAIVANIKSQLEEGIIFLIGLVSPSKANRYLMKVHHDYRGVNKLISGYKNGRSIYERNVDYNRDPIFLSHYLKIAQGTQVLEIPPIDSVAVKKTGDKSRYFVNFSFEEYLEFQVDVKNNEAIFKGYKIGEEDITKLLSPFIQQSTRRAPALLLNFLKSQKPEIVREKIREITFSQSFYTITVTMHTGTYQGVIQDKGSLILNKFQKINDETCFDLSSVQIQSDEVVAAVDSLLKSYYSIEDFNIQNIQVQVKQEEFIYKYLYANNLLKQVEFFLVEKDAQITVSKASILNFGYEILDEGSHAQLFEKIRQGLDSLEFNQKKIVYSEANNTHIRAYLSRENDALEAVFEKENMIIKLSSILYTRNYLVLPSDFQLSQLLVPSLSDNLPSDKELEKLRLIIDAAVQKYPKYIIEPVIKYAQKDKINVYSVYVKSQKGIIKFDGKFSTQENDDDDDDDDDQEEQNSLAVTISNVVITNYEESDFSSCLEFSGSGQCSKCAEEQLPFYGSCFAKLEGCLIQLGDICVKCDTNYVKSHQKCYQECSLFFN